VGSLYKATPILRDATRVEFNSIFKDVYGNVKFPAAESEGDYAAYFIKFFVDKPVFDRIDEIDVTIYSNMDIAELIAGGSKGVREAAKKQLSKARLNAVILLLKAMRERG
jgi:hypothetical protein